MKATGASGGIFTLWNHSTWELTYEHKKVHWLKIEFRNKIIGYQIYIFNIYVASYFRDKEQCWNTLVECMG